MRELLRKAKPERLDDLIALNALYRPGPLKSGMVDDYISRKQGKTEVKYELPQLAPILSDTYGVIAYQEQVMRIAAVLAGFTMGQSDVLRKAMGKKDPKVMAKQREAFMDGRKTERRQREEGDEDLRPDGVLRRLRLQQVALDDLRMGGLPDRLPQGELSAALHGGAADDRSGQHRQARDVPRRMPRAGRADPAAGCEPQRAGLHGRARGRAVRPVRRQERRRGGGPVDPGGAQGARQTRLALHAVRARGSAARQQARPREPDQGRRARLARAPTLQPTRGAPAPGCSPPSDRALEHGSRHQRDRDKGQHQLFGGTADDGEASVCTPGGCRAVA